jgi:hypothetical protein
MYHPFRQDTKNFTKGVVVEDPPPLMLTGVDILAQINTLKEKGGGYEGYGVEHKWTQISGLWRLPYMCDILLPHNIDMMHTENNVAEALFHTTMETKKSKDNVKSRLDQANLCDRSKYCIPRNSNLGRDGKSLQPHMSWPSPEGRKY